MRYGDPGHVPRYSWENRGGGLVRWRFKLISSLVERIGSVQAFVGFESELDLLLASFDYDFLSFGYRFELSSARLQWSLEGWCRFSV